MSHIAYTARMRPKVCTVCKERFRGLEAQIVEYRGCIKEFISKRNGREAMAMPVALGCAYHRTNFELVPEHLVLCCRRSVSVVTLLGVLLGFFMVLH